MLTALLSLPLALAAVAADPLAADTHLKFRGTVAALEADRKPGDAQKTFDLHLFVTERGEAGAKLLWYVDESGRGRWPWIERFGTVSVNAELKPSGDGPALLYARDDGTSVIPLVLPLLSAPGGKPLAADQRWSEETEESRTRGKWQYHVRPAKRDGRDVWQVEVSNGLGHQRTAWVDRDSALVLAHKQRVFMGMGEEYELNLELAETKLLRGEEREASLNSLAALLELRGKLKIEPRSEEVHFDAKQLALLQEQLPAIGRITTTGPLAKLVAAARSELATQSDRSGALEKFAAERRGKPAPKFSVSGLAGETLSSDDLKGGVTVLHFWEYSGEPLKQPYGQTGYLDFLYSKRKAEGVKVYGVAVDAGLADARTKDATLRGVRKMAKFMNLGYGVLIDDGRMISAFGDPRTLKGQLPLYVVIGPDGKIAHYKVGYYEVDRLEGLKELNSVVSEVLKAKK
jgi:peroxiredoxin